MPEERSFADGIRLVRGGDQAAAAELVHRYESVIRRAVRLRLANAQLGSILDSMDIAQSVLASFFVRVAAGEYDLEEPEQLVKLLTTIARKKLVDKTRQELADRRDRRRTVAADNCTAELAAAGPDLCEQLANQELLQEVYRRLSEEELHLVEQRHQGRLWAAIAEDLHVSSVVLRKKLSRALGRVIRELGLESS